MSGQIVSHYRILEKLGAGGMGVVYKAEDLRLGRQVALKFLPENSVRNARALERFKREARNASALDHPGICTIYEIDEEHGQPFIVMQLLEGQTLRDRIGSQPIPLGTLLDWALQITDALQAAHAKGVVHRDIKPANIFITDRGQAKILDFGLAKLTAPDISVSNGATLSETRPLNLTHTGAAIGTVAYMSPEQARGDSVDARTDLFSFGVLLYEMATGKQAFSGPTWAVTVHAILGQAPVALNESVPGLPQQLQEIIDKCLKKNRDLRYQTAAELHHDLSQLKKNYEAGKKLKSVKAAATWTPQRKIRVAIAIAMVVLLASAVAWGPRALRRLTASRVALPGLLLPQRESLAVLPMAAADDPKLAAFGKGLLEDVAAKLSQLSANHDLEVIPARTLVDKKVSTLADATREFGTNLGLSVSLQQDGQLLRATYSLIDGKTDKNVAADSITAPVSDLFTIEDKLTAGVANALQINLRTEERQALDAHSTTVPEAYQYFVEGLGYLQQNAQQETLSSAKTMFEQALKLDPNYGPAQAGLGETYWALYVLTKQKDWADQAQQACSKAIDLGNSGPEGHVCLGTIENGTGQFEKAAEEFQRAVQLDPTNEKGYRLLASTYQNLNELDKAEDTFKRAIAVRPQYWRGYSVLGAFYISQAEYDKAEAMFDRSLSLRGASYYDYSNLGVALLYEGKDSEAIRALEKSISIRPTYAGYANLAVAYFRLRKFDKAALNTAEALKLNGADYQMWGNLAVAQYYDGERTAAMEAYKKAIALGEQQLSVNAHDASVLSDLATYWAMLGDRKKALDYLDRSLAGRNDKELLFAAALVYNQFHETGPALEWLGKALAAGYSKSVVSNAPDLDNLHDNPRYKALMAN